MILRKRAKRDGSGRLSSGRSLGLAGPRHAVGDVAVGGGVAGIRSVVAELASELLDEVA